MLFFFNIFYNKTKPVNEKVQVVETSKFHLDQNDEYEIHIVMILLPNAKKLTVKNNL